MSLIHGNSSNIHGSIFKIHRIIINIPTNLSSEGESHQSTKIIPKIQRNLATIHSNLSNPSNSHPNPSNSHPNPSPPPNSGILGHWLWDKPGKSLLEQKRDIYGPFPNFSSRENPAISVKIQGIPVSLWKCCNPYGITHKSRLEWVKNPAKSRSLFQKIPNFSPQNISI